MDHIFGFIWYDFGVADFVLIWISDKTMWNVWKKTNWNGFSNKGSHHVIYTLDIFQTICYKIFFAGAALEISIYGFRYLIDGLP